MSKKIFIILAIYGLTIFVVVIYTILLASKINDNQSIGLLFAPPALVVLGTCAESVLFAIIFYKHFKELWPVLSIPFLFLAFCGLCLAALYLV